MFQMKFPDGYLWEDPGFPSIAVSYLKTNDFFFSGHAGLPIIMGLEAKKLGYNIIFYFCIFTCLTEVITMIFTRGHYIIDLIAGVVFAHYIYIHVDKYISYIDNSPISICNNVIEECEETKYLKDNEI